jgi:hypothetical protein
LWQRSQLGPTITTSGKGVFAKRNGENPPAGKAAPTNQLLTRDLPSQRIVIIR